MGIEVDQRGVCLTPLPVDGKPVELRPREGEPWPIEEEQEERALEDPPSDPPSTEDGAGFLLPE